MYIFFKPKAVHRKLFARQRGITLSTAVMLVISTMVLMPQTALAFVCDSAAAGESGQGATATGDIEAENVACGTKADADGVDSSNLAVGPRSDASGDRGGNIATGNRADASGGSSSNIATGEGANASGDRSNNIAIGAANSAGDTTNSIAIGYRAGAGNGGIAVGASASATFANSVALGNGATTTRAGQVAIGAASNTYTMPGLTSAASSAAQSGPISVVTTDANGNLAADGGAFFSGFSGLMDDVSDNKEGIAMAMAMDVPYVPPGKTFAMSGGYGHFDGSDAVALSGGFRVNPNVQLDAGLGYGFSRGNLGGRVGVTVAW